MLWFINDIVDKYGRHLKQCAKCEVDKVVLKNESGDIIESSKYSGVVGESTLFLRSYSDLAIKLVLVFEGYLALDIIPNNSYVECKKCHLERDYLVNVDGSLYDFDELLSKYVWAINEDYIDFVGGTKCIRFKFNKNVKLLVIKHRLLL